jgi:hypothetical protein
LFAETALVKTETDNGRLANHLVHLAQNPIVRPMALTTNAAAIDALLLHGLATSSRHGSHALAFTGYHQALRKRQQD